MQLWMDRHPTLMPVHKRHRSAQRNRSSDTRCVQAGRAPQKEDPGSSADKLQREKEKERQVGARTIYKQSEAISPLHVDLPLKITLVKTM